MAERMLQVTLSSSFDPAGFAKLDEAVNKASKPRTVGIGGGGAVPQPTGFFDALSARYGKRSTIGEIADLFQGRGAIGGLGDWARNISAATAAFKEFSAVVATGASQLEALDKIASRVPIIGSAWQAGRDFRSGLADWRATKAANAAPFGSADRVLLQSASDDTALQAAQRLLEESEKRNAARATFTAMQAQVRAQSRNAGATDWQRQVFGITDEANAAKNAARAAQAAGEIAEASLQSLIEAIDKEAARKISELRIKDNREIDAALREANRAAEQNIVDMFTTIAEEAAKSVAIASDMAEKKALDKFGQLSESSRTARGFADAAKLLALGASGDTLGQTIESITQEYRAKIAQTDDAQLKGALADMRDALIGKARTDARSIAPILSSGFNYDGEISSRFRGSELSFMQSQQQSLASAEARKREEDRKSAEEIRKSAEALGKVADKLERAIALARFALIPGPR